MKPKGLRSAIVVALLSLAAFLTIIPPSAFGTCPTGCISTVATGAGSVGVLTTGALTTQLHDYFVVVGEWSIFGGGSSTGTPSDSIGDSFTRDSTSLTTTSGPNGKLNVTIWHAIGKAGPSSTTFTLTFGTTIASAEIQVYDIGTTSVTFIGSGTGTCAGSCGTTTSTSSISYGSNTFIVAGYTGFANAFSAGTGFTWLAGFTADFGSEYATDSLVASPSTFPASCGGACNQGWAGASAAYGSPAVVTTTTTITQSVPVNGPCNFFQLQCWWYPLLFMGLYSGFILMVGTWLRTSPRGKTHLFLTAVTFGSLIAVIFGIMNIVFPLLMLVLNTIIALRLRG